MSILTARRPAFYRWAFVVYAIAESTTAVVVAVIALLASGGSTVYTVVTSRRTAHRKWVIETRLPIYAEFPESVSRVEGFIRSSGYNAEGLAELMWALESRAARIRVVGPPSLYDLATEVQAGLGLLAFGREIPDALRELEGTELDPEDSSEYVAITEPEEAGTRIGRIGWEHYNEKVIAFADLARASVDIR